jgi:hypothetical protein
VTARQLNRAEIMALPAASTLADLAGCLGLSEPVVRRLLHNGELASMGIRVVRLGQQYRVITSSVWLVLGLVRPPQLAAVQPGKPGLRSGSRR